MYLWVSRVLTLSFLRNEKKGNVTKVRKKRSNRSLRGNPKVERQTCEIDRSLLLDRLFGGGGGGQASSFKLSVSLSHSTSMLMVRKLRVPYLTPWTSSTRPDAWFLYSSLYYFSILGRSFPPQDKTTRDSALQITEGWITEMISPTEQATIQPECISIPNQRKCIWNEI